MADNISAGAPSSAPTPNTVPTNTPATANGNSSSDPTQANASTDPVAEAAKASKPAAKPASTKKKFQLKVDGRDEELELDLSNEEELRKHLQMSKAAAKRMQESAEMKKGVQELIETLRNDPMKILADPRLNVSEEVRQKLAQAIINNELEEMSKTPEQKEKERLQREYERLKQQVEAEKKAREEAEFARLQQENAVQFDQEITEAIQQSGLPKNARTVRYMAEALAFCIQNDLNLSAKDIVPYVKKQTLSEFKEMISSLPDEDFENWLGKDQISRIRKRNLAKAKAALQNPATSIKPTGIDAKKEETAKQKIPMKDFMRALGKF